MGCDVEQRFFSNKKYSGMVIKNVVLVLHLNRFSNSGPGKRDGLTAQNQQKINLVSTLKRLQNANKSIQF